VGFRIDVNTLVLEAGRRTPEEFAASRFKNPREMISVTAAALTANNLSPAEGFLLSRLDTPTALGDLVALSGLSELEALRLIYGLALSGVVVREHWKNAFRNEIMQPKASLNKPHENEPVTIEKPPIPSGPPAEVEEDKLDEFLERINEATTHYEVLEVDVKAPPAEIKHAYYELARRYHPDRFRKNATTQMHGRIESAFARITQAYETLMNEGRRSTYNSKLKARERAKTFAKSAPKGSIPTQHPPGSKAGSSTESAGEATRSNAMRAENNFKEGFGALQQGQLNVAIGLLSSAARMVPNEARYRAYYGRVLAAAENTRRLAEVEFQAALKLEPNNSQYRLMLAELFHDLGFSVRARSEAERALALDPNNREARELLHNLA
jgi:curved DNA-binding protein CbpA